MKTVMNHILFPFATTKRSYNILLSVVSLSPVLYSIYIFLTMGKDDITLPEFLQQNAWNSILFLAVLLNLAWLYILFKIHPGVENQHRDDYTGFILWIFFISQIMVTNILLAVISGIVLYKMKVKLWQVLNTKTMFKQKILTFMALSLLLFSLICGYAFIQMTLS